MKLVGSILEAVLKWTITVFFLTMIGLIFFNVVLRYGFNSGITWSEEMGRYLFVWIVFLGAIVAYKERAHLGVDILISSLPLPIQKILYVINNIIVLVILGVFIYGGIQMLPSTSSNYGPATGIPLAFLFIGGLICALSMVLLNIVQTIQFVVFGKNPPDWAKTTEEKGGNY
ncbi:TRAP transporter small permease [Salibacterium salarium]|uniref:TRAP transporter small permease n=1 Tax=Salibacterium salarium TaxID=284579 RepID=A0A3R9WUT3_9BACI|nr:TRAP transporter small permease [Salibacterium salarium]RSL33962.1 TRAP transporter small permease [Salibacterium salarium]